ncbi:MAG TPA: SpoIIE family protein phosphatase [Verrucomicrobiae bacterium]|nr:SpoIIE family protein phosphatase [Verrucomicrobiae bacterium]
MIPRLLLLLFAASSLPAETMFRLDMAGEWRFMAGDNLAYAQPSFDDSAWTTRSLPRRADPPVGYSWLRRRFVLPSDTPQGPLFVSLGTLAEGYEIWCNGVRIGDTGGFADGDRHFARPRTFRVPAGLLQAGQPFTIAIRVFCTLTRGPRPWQLSTLSDPGPYVVTDSASIPADVVPLETLRREKLVAFGYLTSTVRALLILLLLGTWLIDRSRRELLFLSLMLGADLVSRLTECLIISLDSSFLTFRLVVLTAILSGVLLVRFASEVFRIRSRWLPLAIWAPPVLFLFAAGPATIPVEAISFSLLDVGEIMVVFWAVRAARGAIHSAGWQPGPFLMATCLGMVALLQTQRHFPLPGFSLYLQAAGYLFHLYDIVVILLTALMTLILLLSLGADRREKHRLAGELDAARAVQQLLLAPPVATPGYDIATVYEPAQEVGGDFYWTRRDSSGSLLLVAGDVSGKGLRAAMLVNLTIGALRERDIDSPAAILSLLNHVLADQTGGGFVTAISLRLGRDGKIVAATAGHPAPYLNGESCNLTPALPLGVDSEATYGETDFHLANGGQLTIVSDGVIEAANSKGDLFGFERACEISSRPAAQIAEAARAWGQNDDITVVTIRRSR